MTLRVRVLFIGSLLALMSASALFGWRANITFEPTPVKYVPVLTRDTLAWDMNRWIDER